MPASVGEATRGLIAPPAVKLMTQARTAITPHIAIARRLRCPLPTSTATIPNKGRASPKKTGTSGV